MKTVFVLWIIISHNSMETRPLLSFPTMEMCAKASVKFNAIVRGNQATECIEQPEAPTPETTP